MICGQSHFEKRKKRLLVSQTIIIYTAQNRAPSPGWIPFRFFFKKLQNKQTENQDSSTTAGGNASRKDPNKI